MKLSFSLLYLLAVGTAVKEQPSSNRHVRRRVGDHAKSGSRSSSKHGGKHKAFKNVIMMIPDGCDEAIQTLARWYKGQDLHLDGLPRTSVKTFVANSVIADSASAATAFATGYKTSVGFLSVGPRHDTLLSIYYNNATKYDMALQYAPMATILEAAKSVGKSTGLVATGQVIDATPAAFASHVDYRYKQEEIMKHLVYNNVDVVFGGGKEWLLPASTCPNAIANGGRRLDCQDLRQVLEQRGYKICETRQQL